MKQTDLQLTGGAGKTKRRELDFYPTPSNVTIALLNFLFERNYLVATSKIWEPACGNGAMSEVIKKYCKDVYSSDLYNLGYGNMGVDFLSTKNNTFDAIITNPPFNMSTKFIEKAVKEADIVCMLLKSQYWHSKSRYELFMQNTPAYILPLTWRPNFLEHEQKGGSPTMEVAWTVWIKGNNNAFYFPLKKP